MDTTALYNHFLGNFGMPARLSALALRDLLQLQLQAQSRNPLNRFGNKVYSQNDEDGITFEIARRLGLSKGNFLELGVGNGLENNTLALLAAGWRGVWMGGEDLAFQPDQGQGNRARLRFRKGWITPDNCAAFALEELKAMEIASIELLSVDLDGNDIPITERLLDAGMRPRVLIVEYNAKFPPPIEFCVAQVDGHQWAGDDYMGASLQHVVNRLEPRGYRLVCCNLSGCNAFLVAEADMDKFLDVPGSIYDIYQPARYHFSYLLSAGHVSSLKTIEGFLKAQ
jgi:hypothetical protein